MAGGKIVATIEHDASLADQLFQPLVFCPLLQGIDLYIGVDLFQRLLAGTGLGLADSCRGMQDLPLQIGQVYLIIVNQGDIANTGAGQVQCRWRTKSASAYDQGMCCADFLLAFYAYLVEQDMTGIA